MDMLELSRYTRCDLLSFCDQVIKTGFFFSLASSVRRSLRALMKASCRVEEAHVAQKEQTPANSPHGRVRDPQPNKGPGAANSLRMRMAASPSQRSLRTTDLGQCQGLLGLLGPHNMPSRLHSACSATATQTARQATTC